MKTKRLMAGILTGAVCISMLAACGNNDAPSQESKTDNNTQTTSQDSKTEESKAPETVKKTLYVRDNGKNEEMTATFYNSVSGKTENVKMTKSEEKDDFVVFSCEGDTSLYNMVHVNYKNGPSMDVSFNAFVSGWYLFNNAMLPYVVGSEPDYDPEFETKVFQFEGYDKNVYIWTPDDYDAKAEEKYSTIYMFDGQSVLATGKERGMDNDLECWNVSENVESMIAATGNKAIIVAIATDGSTRYDELIPDIGDLVTDELGTKKNGNKFADFVCDTVMPYVQENYNVYTDAQHNAIGGSSLGGLESFYAALAHPDKFATAGVLSPSFQLYDEKVWNAFLADKVTMENAPFLYIYSGGYATDTGSVTEPVYNSLVESGYPKDKIVFSKYEKGEHFISYWRNIYSEFLEAMFTQKVTGLENGVEVKYVDKTDPYEIKIEDVSIDPNDDRPDEIKYSVFYDNSETKWENVYVYWWGGRPVNRLTKEMYYNEWPGFKMEQIEGTDIYKINAPLGATGIIFNSGVTDAEVREGITAYQTVDLGYSMILMGQIYKIDMTQEAKPGKGVEKTKFKYPAGEWKKYEN